VKAIALAVLLVCASLAVAQTPAPSQPQPQDTTPPKPRPPLNLSLDPADQPRARITFEPREDKKAPAEKSLPGMGGEQTRSWEAPSDRVFPPDTNPNAR